MSGNGTAPSITVVVPVYNNSAGARRTLGALAGRLGEYAATDVVVVDDGSTDDTAAVIAGLVGHLPTVRLISTANAGPSAARNRGARAGRGSHLAFLDANDEPLPGWLTSFAEGLRGGAAMVHCDSVHADATANNEYGFLLPGCFAVARDVFEAVNGYDEALRFAENTDLIERAHFWCARHGRPVIRVRRRLLYVHDVSDPRRYDGARVDAVTYLLARDATTLRHDRKRRARLARVGAVSAARIGRRREARRLARTAAFAQPLGARNWARLAMTIVPAVSRWRWGVRSPTGCV